MSRTLRSENVECTIYRFECCGIDTVITSGKYVIVSIYRPNSSHWSDIKVFFDRIHDLFQKLTLENSRFVVSGNFNIDLLSPTNETNKFISLIESFNSNFWSHVNLCDVHQ